MDICISYIAQSYNHIPSLTLKHPLVSVEACCQKTTIASTKLVSLFCLSKSRLKWRKRRSNDHVSFALTVTQPTVWGVNIKYLLLITLEECSSRAKLQPLSLSSEDNPFDRICCPICIRSVIGHFSRTRRQRPLSPLSASRLVLSKQDLRNHPFQHW